MADTSQTKRKKMKHNYTSELELKSLLIRIKNDRVDFGSYTDNTKINKYVKWHTKINNKKYDSPTKRNIVKNKLKARIIELSEKTRIDTDSYERFGEIILLMIKNILKKPQFSGYTYKDDFYSDAVYKILKYLHNFNHTLISERTGQAVNAFAYISQIIHNSILYIINTKKKDLENLRKHICAEHMMSDSTGKNYDWLDKDTNIDDCDSKTKITENVYLSEIKTNLIDELHNLEEDIERVNQLNVYYPKDYVISFEEYNELKEMLRGKVSIMRSPDEH